MNKTVLFCTGLSGSGKSYFVQNILPAHTFYNLKSATTRPMRANEQDGREYYFRDEQYFDTQKFVTRLFVNEAIWKPGMPKWLYGVPEFEVYNHMGQNFTYDVIEPKYVRQMIDWFKNNNLGDKYDFRVLWFQPPKNQADIVKSRANMPDDTKVRKMNTCNAQDFEKAGVNPDHLVVCQPGVVSIDASLRQFIDSLQKTK